jgi:hypothetical protein
MQVGAADSNALGAEPAESDAMSTPDAPIPSPAEALVAEIARSALDTRTLQTR